MAHRRPVAVVVAITREFGSNVTRASFGGSPVVCHHQAPVGCHGQGRTSSSSKISLHRSTHPSQMLTPEPDGPSTIPLTCVWFIPQKEQMKGAVLGLQAGRASWRRRVGTLSGGSPVLCQRQDGTSTSMTSLHRSMHSLQTYTPGPAISFLTCSLRFPQNEHFRSEWLALAQSPGADRWRNSFGALAIRKRGYEVLLNKAVWHAPATGRRDLWRPSAGSLMPSPISS
jgi:hypothetical protein